MSIEVKVFFAIVEIFGLSLTLLELLSPEKATKLQNGIARIDDVVLSKYQGAWIAPFMFFSQAFNVSELWKSSKRTIMAGVGFGLTFFIMAIIFSPALFVLFYSIEVLFNGVVGGIAYGNIINYMFPLLWGTVIYFIYLALVYVATSPLRIFKISKKLGIDKQTDVSFKSIGAKGMLYLYLCIVLVFIPGILFPHGFIVFLSHYYVSMLGVSSIFHIFLIVICWFIIMLTININILILRKVLNRMSKFLCVVSKNRPLLALGLISAATGLLGTIYQFV